MYCADDNGRLSPPEWFPILMYHRVVAVAGADRIDAQATPLQLISGHLDWLAAHRYTTTPLAEALDSKLRRTCLTFDDGFADAHDVALPLLVEKKVPATVFVVTNLIGRKSEWMPAPQQLLSETQVRELHAEGVVIGSHSRTHRGLTDLSDSELWDEVTGSRADLEDLLGAPVDCFCYPYNDVDERVIDAVRRAGYRLAVGGDRLPHQRHHLRRFDAAQLTLAQLALRVRGFHHWGRGHAVLEPIRRLVRRLA